MNTMNSENSPNSEVDEAKEPEANWLACGCLAIGLLLFCTLSLYMSHTGWQLWQLGCFDCSQAQLQEKDLRGLSVIQWFLILRLIS